MFNKILVPLDGSELAASVLPQVVELAKAFKSQVTLMHACYAPIAPEMIEASPKVLEESAELNQKACELFLAEAAQKLKAQGVDANTVCVEGIPAREIVGYAELKSMDMIVMATHGRGEVAWVLGSVAERVVSHATVPVLLQRVLKPKQPLLKAEYFLP